MYLDPVVVSLIWVLASGEFALMAIDLGLARARNVHGRELVRGSRD